MHFSLEAELRKMLVWGEKGGARERERWGIGREGGTGQDRDRQKDRELERQREA